MKTKRTLWSMVLSCVFYSSVSHADLLSQCLLGIPQYNHPRIFADPSTLPLYIQSNQCCIQGQQSACFSGGVAVWQGNWHLTTETLQIEQQLLRTMTARGPVRYFDPDIQLVGHCAQYDIDNKDLAIKGAHYQFVGRQGRGTAQAVQRKKGRYTVIKQGCLTTCLPGDNSWKIEGSTIVHDSQREVAEIWNARFSVVGIPILYMPYWQLPTGQTRRSGFLNPSIELPAKLNPQQITKEIEFSLPYYWNIAPNVDAVITPHYMAHRGLQGQLKLRYLTLPGSGTLAYEYLKQDRLQSNKHSRFLRHWKHDGVLKDHWRFSVNHTKVSDKHYFSDLKSEYGIITDNYATQEYSTSYTGQRWYYRLLTRDFQLFQDTNGQAYRLQPQLDVRYFEERWLDQALDFNLHAQAARFKSSNLQLPSATRLYLEPRITARIPHGRANISLETALLAAHYQQNVPSEYRGPELRTTVNRVLPYFKAESNLLFERSLNREGATYQTLEPRIQYLYLPYRDQHCIASYDSGLLQKGYDGLFSGRQYSGLDWIASANQISVGATTRLFDQAFNECFNFSLGQIYQLNRPKIGIPMQDKLLNLGSVGWAANSSWVFANQWSLHSAVHYSQYDKKLSVADAMMEYRMDDYRVAQVNYHFASQHSLRANQLNHYQPLDKGISQIGLTASWLLRERWAVVGAYHYDFNYRRTAKRQIGFQYSTCCWAISLSYDHLLLGQQHHAPLSGGKIALKISLRGLGNDHDLGFNRLLDTGILPYQRPLLLSK